MFSHENMDTNLIETNMLETEAVYNSSSGIMFSGDFVHGLYTHLCVLNSKKNGCYEKIIYYTLNRSETYLLKYLKNKSYFCFL